MLVDLPIGPVINCVYFRVILVLLFDQKTGKFKGALLPQSKLLHQNLSKFADFDGCVGLVIVENYLINLVETASFKLQKSSEPSEPDFYLVSLYKPQVLYTAFRLL